MSFFSIRRLTFLLMTALTFAFCFYLGVLFFDYMKELSILNEKQRTDLNRLITERNDFLLGNDVAVNALYEIDVEGELRELASAKDAIINAKIIENSAERCFLEEEASQQINMLKTRIDQKFNQAIIRNQMTYAEAFEIHFSYLVHHIIPLILGYILGVLVVSLLGVYVTSEVLKRALAKLSFGAKKIRDGDYTFRFEAGRLDDEIESVKLDFNIMSQHLLLQQKQLKKTHDALLQTLMRLQNANAYKDQFLANMSHELRTPLSALMGFSEIIQQKGVGVGDEKLKHYAATMIKSSEHLLELISRLLHVAQISADQYQPQKEDVDINDIATTVIEMLMPLAHKKNNRLIYENQLTVENCVCVKLAIQQILVNLLQNAIKFTHNGEIKLLIYNENNDFVFVVQDTGIGVDIEEQENLFIDFYRSESSYTSQTQGVGLGLTIVRKWVDFHGGRIILKSKPNEGARFEIYLPAINRGVEE